MEWPFNQRKQRKGRQAFSPAEDDLLRKLVEKHGENNWAEVAEHMPHRNSRQCRDRWRGYLRPTLVNSQWLPEEDQILLKKYEEFGPKWSVIGHYIPGRSEINIKNRWKLLMQYCSMVPQRQQPNGAFPVWQTPSQIYQHYQLAKDIHNFPRNEWYTKEWTDFMDANRIYTEQSVEAYSDELYWKQVGLIMKQFHGLVDGYNSVAPENEKLNETDFWFIQAECEIYDVEKAIDVKSRKKHSEAAEHCTGLIRLLDDYSDVFFSHDTWSDFRDLHGQLKEYHFPIKEFQATRLIFSTRVGKLFSYDDFYMADTGLLVLETTLSIYNESLYDISQVSALTPKDNDQSKYNRLFGLLLVLFQFPDLKDPHFMIFVDSFIDRNNGCITGTIKISTKMTPVTELSILKDKVKRAFREISIMKLTGFCVFQKEDLSKGTAYYRFATSWCNKTSHSQ